MPALDALYPYISYITAAGDEVILSCESYKKWWECYGREGFAAPSLDYVTRQYADGMTDTLAVIMKPRPLSVQMVVVGESCRERDEILADMASRLIQLGSRKNWGRLKVMRSDGSYVFIDCVYIGGMDEIIPEVEDDSDIPSQEFGEIENELSLEDVREDEERKADEDDSEEEE